MAKCTYLNYFNYTLISGVLSAGVCLGRLTLPSASGLQQLEGNVHWDERDPGTPRLLDTILTLKYEVTYDTWSLYLMKQLILSLVAVDCPEGYQIYKAS